MKRLFLAIVLLAIVQLVHASQCNDAVPATAPASRFLITGDEAADNATGLIWKRCPVGFALNDQGTAGDTSDDTCDETATASFTWQTALATADATWRLPNIKELDSIVERRCSNMTIDPDVFPAVTVSAPYDAVFWSTTPRPSSGVNVVNFNTGRIFGATTWVSARTRLVKR